MDTATQILNNARNEIKDIIALTGVCIYNKTHKEYPNWENGEEWVVDFKDITPSGKFYITLNVWDDGDTTHREDFVLNSLHITLDENLFFWDDENEEHHYGELDLNELAEISNILEDYLMKIISLA